MLNRLCRLEIYHADVKTTAFIIEGTALIPARRPAITNGDSEAFPVEFKRLDSFDGTSKPTINIVTTALDDVLEMTQFKEEPSKLP
jgi:hypothetical protein